MKVRFGENLARCRNHVDISQEELGFRASIHRTEVGLLERGERIPRVDTALRIAGSLGVPLDDLVAGLEWRPGYEIVVPGSWEIAEGNGRAQSSPDSPDDLEGSSAGSQARVACTMSALLSLSREAVAQTPPIRAADDVNRR